MSEELKDENLPILTPTQAVGGGVTVGRNPNLPDLDQVIVTVELLVYVPTEDGPMPAIMPIIMETGVWNMLLANVQTEHNTQEEA